MQGEYYLQGIPETASGFRFEKDSSFQFFFSQGALDRYAKGKWRVEGNRVILNSKPKPASDYEWISSSSKPGNGLTIRIVEGNRNLLRYFVAGLKHGDDVDPLPCNQDGIIVLQPVPFDSLLLAFEFSPERYSLFKIDYPQHNYFEFKVKPWLFEYFFENFTLEIKDGVLNGPHPLLQGKNFRYLKN